MKKPYIPWHNRVNEAELKKTVNEFLTLLNGRGVRVKNLAVQWTGEKCDATLTIDDDKTIH